MRLSYYQFPAVNKIKVIDATGEHLGAFQVSDAQTLEHLALGFYIKGTTGGSERMRLQLYGAARYDNSLVVSDWVSLSDISAGDWIGNVRFDFGGFPLNPNYYYQMKLETQNYTRNGSTFYLAAVCDYGSSVSNRVSANDVAVYMTIAGRR